MPGITNDRTGTQQYIEDTAHVSGDTGDLILAVRNDVGGAMGADGDYVPIQVDAAGRLRVAVTGAAGGTSAVDDSAFTVGADSLTPAGGIYRSVRDPVDDNDVGVFAMNQKRGMYVTIETPLADSAMDEVNDAVRVNVVAGGGAGGTSMVDDAAFTPAVTNITPMGAFADEVAPDSVDEGDAGIVRMSLNRVLYAQLRDAAGNERGLNIDAAGSIAVTDGGGALSVDDNGVTLSVDDGGGTITVDDGGVTLSVDDGGGTLTVDNLVLSIVGAGAEATAQRVTIANDSTGLLSVDDNGGSLTVDGGVTADIRDGAGVALTSTLVGADQALDVNIVQTVGGAGGTSMADDAVFTPAVTNITPMGAFADEVAPDSVDEGDAGIVRMSLNRNLYTSIRDAAGNERGVNVTAANELNVANTVLSVVGGGGEATAQRVTIANDSTGVLSVDDNAGSLTVDNAALSVLGGGAEAGTLRVTIANDSTGLLSVDDNGGSLTVDGAGTSMVDDAGFTVEVDLVTPIGALYDSSGIDSVDEDDVGIVRMSANRNLFINLQDAAGNERGANVNASNELEVANSVLSVVGGGAEATAQRVTIANDSTGLLSVDDNGGALTVDSANHDSMPVNANMQIGDADAAVGNPVPVAGTAAEAAAVAGNPVLIGGRHHASVVAGDAVADGEAVRQLSDSVGGTVKGHRADAWTANGNYAAAQTDTEVKAQPGANLYLYVTDILFTTEGANNIFLESAAATMVPVVYLAANGGWTGHFQTPIRWPVNTAITITSSAAVNHSVLINGYTAPI